MADSANGHFLPSSDQKSRQPNAKSAIADQRKRHFKERWARHICADAVTDVEPDATVVNNAQPVRVYIPARASRRKPLAAQSGLHDRRHRSEIHDGLKWAANKPRKVHNVCLTFRTFKNIWANQKSFDPWWRTMPCHAWMERSELNYLKSALTKENWVIICEKTFYGHEKKIFWIRKNILETILNLIKIF